MVAPSTGVAVGTDSRGLESVTFVDVKNGEGYVVDSAGLISTSSAASGSCYNYRGIHWPWSRIPVGFSVSTGMSAPSGASGAVQWGFEQWNSAGTSFRFTVGGGGSVSWEPIDGSTGPILAMATIWYDPVSKEISAASIMFDEAEPWATNGDGNRYDVQSIAVHESGHWLQLLHTGCSGNVMLPTIPKGELRRSLGSGDIAGINAIYGGGGPLPTPTGYTVTVTVLDSARNPVQDAAVYLDRVLKGNTNYSGTIVIAGVSKGLHTVTVKKEGYKDATKSVNVRKDMSITLYLQSRAGPGPTPGPTPTGATVVVSVFDSSGTSISGASVYLDGAKRGTTDSYGRLAIMGVAVGWHTFTVKRTGYQDSTQQVDVQRDMLLSIVLQH